MLQVKIEIKSDEINNSNTVIASLLTLEVLFGEQQRRKITFDSRIKQLIRIGRIKNDETDFAFEDEDDTSNIKTDEPVKNDIDETKKIDISFSQKYNMYFNPVKPIGADDETQSGGEKNE